MLILAAAAVAAAAGRWALHRRQGMDPAEVLRKLAGMRLAVELYRQERKRPPDSFADTVRSGKLEEIFEIKLPRHPRRRTARDVGSMEISDTGGWAYVNDPKDKDFGLVYIDCTHMDGKGRFWSEF